MALPPTDRFSIAAAHRQPDADGHQRSESGKVLADIDAAIGQWDDLSDDELRARLAQRGVDDDAAASLSRHREDCEPEIAAVLGDR